MVTGNQLRLARFALRWSVQQLSENTGVPLRTVKRVEAEDGIPSTNASTIHILQAALETAGIEFIGTPDDGPGIRIYDGSPKS